jgi:hypothetical protein
MAALDPYEAALRDEQAGMDRRLDGVPPGLAAPLCNGGPARPVRRGRRWSGTWSAAAYGHARRSPLDEELRSLISLAEAALDGVPRPAAADGGLMVCPWFRIGSTVVRTSAMTARFDHPTEVTLDDLRIELMYPMEDDADRFFRAHHSQMCLPLGSRLRRSRRATPVWISERSSGIPRRHRNRLTNIPGTPAHAGTITSSVLIAMASRMLRATGYLSAWKLCTRSATAGSAPASTVSW